MSRDDAVGVRIGDETIGEMVPAAPVGARCESAADQRFQPPVPERGARRTGSQLDPESLGRPRFEVPGLDDPEELAFHARRNMRRQRLEGHARVRELGRKRGIFGERRHETTRRRRRRRARAPARRSQHLPALLPLGIVHSRHGSAETCVIWPPPVDALDDGQSSGSSMFRLCGGDILRRDFVAISWARLHRTAPGAKQMTAPLSTGFRHVLAASPALTGCPPRTARPTVASIVDTHRVVCGGSSSTLTTESAPEATARATAS